MCQLCALTRTFDPARHADAATAFAEIREGSDAAASSSTLYDLSVGDSFSGALDYEGDRDWVRVTLTAGSTYEIALTATLCLIPICGCTTPAARWWRRMTTMVASTPV